MRHKILALVAGPAISALMLAPDTALARGDFAASAYYPNYYSYYPYGGYGSC
jgi:hypothetical protein